MNARQLRILFLFAHLHKGGMQRAVSNISQALGDQYQQFVGYFGTEDPGFRYSATLQDFAIPGKRALGPAGKAVNFLRRLAVLRTFVRTKRIDVVVSFGEAANIINLACPHGARKIASVRVSLDESLQHTGRYKALYEWLIRKLYPRAEIIVAVSNALAEQVRARLSRRVPVVAIPNLYNIDDIRRQATQPLPKHCEQFESRPFILNVGSFCHQKGQDLLIQAFAAAKDRLPHVELILMGRGEIRQQLENLARQANVRERVKFVDFDANPYRFMARAAAFVLSSRFEGFPNVLVEAMACGAPVISFDCSTGPREILGPSTFGMLVTELAPDRLANALVEMLTDDKNSKRYGELSQVRSLDFCADTVLPRWTSLFDRRVDSLPMQAFG